MGSIAQREEGMAIRNGDRVLRSGQDESIVESSSVLLVEHGRNVQARRVSVISFAQDPEALEWACRKLDVQRAYFGKCAIISIDDPKTVVVYSSFNGINCEITVASDGVFWTRPEYMKVFLAYPFQQLGCRRVTILVMESNNRVCRLAKRMGFTEEGVLRKYMASGEDVHILGLLKEDYEKGRYYEKSQ